MRESVRVPRGAGYRPAEILSRLSTLFFLFRVSRGDISLFPGERSGLMNPDKLLISTEELPWQKPISACRPRLNECLGGDNPEPSQSLANFRIADHAGSTPDTSIVRCAVFNTAAFQAFKAVNRD